MFNNTTTRRTFLTGVGSTVIGSTALSSPVTAKGRKNGFPPKGITTWGDSAPLGDGEVSTFSSVTPSGNPKYVGIHLSDGALTDLPSPDDLEGQGEGPWNGGEVANLHGGFWSKLHSLDFPENTPEPIEYMGFGWNSQGHNPTGVYSKPHFDIHFYFHSRADITTIGPGVITADDIADGQIPEAYRLIEGGAVIPNMGAHLAPKDGPEFEDREDASQWLKTLIWGAADLNDDGVFDLNFVEPMVTLDYFENHLDGVHKEEIVQPDIYPMEGWYPTVYSMRELGDGGYAVVMQDFEKQDA